MASRGGGAKPPLREVRDPVRQASWLGADTSLAAENRHGGAPRGVPVAPGRGGRASQARQAKECACRRSTRPSSGVGPAAVATVTGSSPPQRQSTGRRCGDKRRDKREKARQGPGTQTCAAGTRGAARHKPRSGLFDIVKTERERARRASAGLCTAAGDDTGRMIPKSCGLFG